MSPRICHRTCVKVRWICPMVMRNFPGVGCLSLTLIIKGRIYLIYVGLVPYRFFFPSFKSDSRLSLFTAIESVFPVKTTIKIMPDNRVFSVNTYQGRVSGDNNKRDYAR